MISLESLKTLFRGRHIAPRQRWSRNEVIVNIKILHSHNVDGPVDESQERCLNERRRISYAEGKKESFIAMMNENGYVGEDT